MVSRAAVSQIHNIAQMSTSRATVREFDDKHLMQQVKQADVYRSETPSDFERWQMVGITAVPLKQEQQQQTQQSQQTNARDGDWNQNQPRGKAAEALMVYVGGSRSHPVAIVDDRRVRPYNMKEGENAVYHAAGSEQMMFMNDAGAYLVSLDGKSVKNKNGNETRMASLRHVTKDMQTHEIKEGEQQQEYKHEGKTVNTEVRCIKDRIEFRAGDTVVGYYEKSSETWYFKGKIAQMEFSDKIERSAPTISETVSSRYETVGNTYLGLNSKGEQAQHKVEGDFGGGSALARKVFIKGEDPAAPD